MSDAHATGHDGRPDEEGADSEPVRDGRVRGALRSVLNRDAIRSAVRIRLGMDARSIAAFRILLGLVLLFDVVHRATDLRTFYTDQGVLPRELLYADWRWTAEYSLHALSGDAWFQALLFAITGLLAIALLVGYRPRLAALLAVGLVMSLHLRNPYVLNAGDRLLRELLVLAIFLPLTERWAIRSSRTSRSHPATPATAGAFLYIVTIFFGNAMEKRAGDTWPTGEALDYAMRQDHMTILLGNHLADYPLLLELGTYGWFGLLFSSPLLLLTADQGRLLHCLAFLGAVTGLGLSVAVGLFPPLLAAAIALFLPARFWNGLERVAIGSRRRLVARTNRASIPAPIAESLAALRSTGRRLVAEPGRRLGAGLGRLDRRASEAIGRASTPETRRLARRGWSVVLVGMLVVVACLSVGMLGVAQPFEPVEEFDAEDYAWGVYAPNPSDSYGFWMVEGERVDGGSVDVLRERAWSEPPPSEPATTFPSFRWRKYGHVLHDDALADEYRAAYTAYMCTRENERFEGAVTAVRVTYTDVDLDRSGEVDRRTIEIAERACDT